MKRQEAPGRLEMVRTFVNTLDLERGIDEFATDEGLASWLSIAGLVEAQCPVLPGERQVAVAVREALRQLGAGRLEDPSALDGAARLADIAVGFGLDGRPILTPRKAGVPGAVATILVTAAAAVMDGTWLRMRVCAAEDCRWMFYDHSKNRSGTWCQMAECGNRAKSRAFRSRARAGVPARSPGSQTV